ncbi:hypothetical protein LP414_05755 [Polaromonas sp. P1(28)-13]|nr:hypothetical protein LP414_05755 [Polaromonas sp. P1(28)-13]
MAKFNPEIAISLANRKKRLAIVFVPGILGSKLTSADGKVIFGDISEVKTIISRLELPAKLIDENAESGVRAELLLKLGWVDLYEDATNPMREWANAHGVQFVTCGYDWRRDIRAGTRDLERCLQRELNDGPRDVVLIAHSMGGW